MIFTIRPPVRWRWGLWVVGAWAKSALFLVAAALGGLAVTSSTAALGRWIGLNQGGWVRFVLLALGLTLAVIDIGWGKVQLPHRHHQVQRDTILRHPWLGTVPYGFGLGTGFWTDVNIALPYFLLLLIAIAGDWGLAISSATAFAAGRALPVALSGFYRDFPVETFSSWAGHQGYRAAQLVSSAVLVVVSLYVFGLP